MEVNIVNFYLEGRSRETGEWCNVGNSDSMDELEEFKDYMVRENDEYDGYRMIVEFLESE